MTARTTVRRDRSGNRNPAVPVAERAQLAFIGRRPAAVEARDDRGARAYRELERQLSGLRTYIYRNEAHGRDTVRYHELLADHLSALLAVAYPNGVPTACAPASSHRRPRNGHRPTAGPFAPSETGTV